MLDLMRINSVGQVTFELTGLFTGLGKTNHGVGAQTVFLSGSLAHHPEHPATTMGKSDIHLQVSHTPDREVTGILDPLFGFKHS